MTEQTKCDQLRRTVINILKPLIDNDYVLWDLPYYCNIGDHLIWEGTEQFLKTLPYKCLNRCSHLSFTHPKLKKNTIILLQGGGNFGDLHVNFQNFRNTVIKDYPENKIIILPQTIYYSDLNNAAFDAEISQKHNSLYICARDENSYKMMLNYNFVTPDHLFLVPDMAYCIDTISLRKFCKKPVFSNLFLNRIDEEQGSYEYSKIIPNNAITHDWPPFEKPDTIVKRMEWIKWKFGNKNKIVNLYARYIYHPHLIKQGVRFLSEYENIYSTRLHVSILSTLLMKRISIIDNSYGKNSWFYNTWLKGTTNVSFIASAK